MLTARNQNADRLRWLPAANVGPVLGIGANPGPKQALSVDPMRDLPAATDAFFLTDTGSDQPFTKLLSVQ